MNELLPVIGPWFWWIAAAVLLIGELLLPGVFLMWLAVAAGLTGLVDFALGFGWRGEVVSFGVLSAALVALTWKWVTAKWQPPSDQPHLNQRHYNYVGQNYVLEQPIVSGRGKLRVEDALWEVSGPDLPTGARVKVTGVQGLKLTVEAI
jgi:inner membrane protein